LLFLDVKVNTLILICLKKAAMYPGTTLFSNNNIKGIESYSIVPKWGIRRNLGNNFTYEVGTGFGFRHEVDYGNYAEIDLHLRIGYTF